VGETFSVDVFFGKRKTTGATCGVCWQKPFGQLPKPSGGAVVKWVQRVLDLSDILSTSFQVISFLTGMSLIEKTRAVKLKIM